MSRRDIKKELEYIKFLEIEIKNAKNKEHFRAAIEWRWAQAEAYRKWFYFFKWLQAVFGAVIIVLGALSSRNVGLLVVIFGCLSTLSAFALSCHKYYDSWKRYRETVEKIKSLTRLYVSGNEPFVLSDDENDKLYVVELDKLIGSETSGWKDMRDRGVVVNVDEVKCNL